MYQKENAVKVSEIANEKQRLEKGQGIVEENRKGQVNKSKKKVCISFL